MLGWFADKLGLPVIVMGVVCFVLMQVGSWFRRIANQAAEFCERVVEAQFAAQTKRLKVERRDRDLRFLAERVTVPEVRLRTSDDLDDADDGHGRRRHGRRGRGPRRPRRRRRRGLRPRGSTSASSRPRPAFLHTLNLLYDDYLDGSPFHRNDTKASTQLLGNLALRNLSLSNLPYFLRGRRRLDRLDLNRAAASLFGGPLPLVRLHHPDDRPGDGQAPDRLQPPRRPARTAGVQPRPRSASRIAAGWRPRLHLPPERDRAARAGRPARRAPGGRRAAPERPEAAEFFETVDFTAVDFLIADPRRDEEIRRRGTATPSPRWSAATASRTSAGPSAASRCTGRRWPSGRSTSFTSTRRFLAKGRLIVLPFRIALVGAPRASPSSSAGSSRVIREILAPDRRGRPDEPEDSYPAAVRKIHRMRKPAFMESLWLRGRFDVEYLGLPLPTVPISVGSDSLMETDLDFIGASRHERVMADRLPRGPAAPARPAGRAGSTPSAGASSGLPGILARDFPHLADRRGEVIRALTVAWVADHDDVETLGASIEALRAIAAHAADPSSDLRRLPEGLPETVDPGEPLWHRLRSVRGSLVGVPGPRRCFPEYDDGGPEADRPLPPPPPAVRPRLDRASSGARAAPTRSPPSRPGSAR